ncbi:MAG: hypothetical protein C5B58_13110 [Acidobacteria bacterium]|nr:MAG: hypothetical protein C5B58_13110 [Acidobacteriota bacterium]
MTRDEKEQRIRRQDGKAFATYNIEIHEGYRDPLYTVSKETSNVISGTGLLKVFELKPSHDGPSFIGRWDGGSRDAGKEERYDLDIDIEGVSDQEQRRFEKEKGGYAGHHTTKVDSDRGWKYHVCIHTPAGIVFEGTGCFNLHRKIGCEDNPTVSDTATANLHQHRQCEENVCVTDTAVATVTRWRPVSD